MTVKERNSLEVPYAKCSRKVLFLSRPASRITCMLLVLFGLQQAGITQTPDCGCRYQASRFKAYLYTAQEKPDSALFHYKAAFSSGHAAVNDLLMATGQAILIDSLTAARRFILTAFGKGLSVESFRRFVRTSGRGKINENDWIPADTIRQITARFRSRLDTTLLRVLERLEADDQRFRGDGDDRDAERRIQDSLNAGALKHLVRSMGRLPDFHEIGFRGVDILRLLFLHMDRENLDWFLPHIMRQVHKCEYFDVEGLAYQIDRIAVSSGMALYVDEDNHLRYDTNMPVFLNKQYYSVTGYWYDMSPFDGANYFWPVYGPLLNGQMQMTRKRLCLDPYEQYLQRNSYIKTVPEAELKKLFGG